MSRKCRSERAAQQQAVICGGLVRLMEEQSYHQITVRDICARAQVPRRTFYYYFEGKDEVLECLLDTVIRESSLEAMLPLEADGECVQKEFSRFFRFWRDNRASELKVLIRNGFAGRLIQRSAQWSSTESLWATELRKKISGLDAMGAQIGATVIYYVLMYWCEGGFTQHEDEVAAYTTELLTKPLYRLS